MAAFRHLLHVVETISIPVSVAATTATAFHSVSLFQPDAWWLLAVPLLIPVLFLYGLVQVDARCRKQAAEARIREAEATMREADARMAKSRASLVHALVTRWVEADGCVPSDAIVTAVISQKSPDVSVLNDPPIVGPISIGSTKGGAV